MNVTPIDVRLATIRSELASLQAELALDTAHVVHLEDASSRMSHIGFRRAVDRELATFEGCNLDDAGARREITRAEADAKPDKLRCLRCYARRDAADSVTSAEAATEEYAGG